MKKKRFNEVQIINNIKEYDAGSKVDNETKVCTRLKELADGRRFRILNVVDDYSRECIGQLVAPSISGYQSSRLLSQLVEQRGKPEAIVCGNGSEFTGKAMFF